MKTSLIVFALLLSVFSALADSKPKTDPIDAALDAAIDKDPSTAGMIHATVDATAKWDKRMNSAYQSLKKKMASDEWGALLGAQKAWVNYRDLQIQSIQVTFSKMDGTMWRPVCASEIMDITKQRALFLESLLGTISER